MNKDAFFPAGASRRNVLLGGQIATVAAGPSPAVLAQTAQKQTLLSSHPSKGTKTMSTITTKDGTEIY